MSVKESINNQNEPFSIEKDCINEGETQAFYDDRIKASILFSLKGYSNIPIEEISVTVKYGIVNLYGVVPWMYQKMIITAMVKNTTGVTGLINNICVVNEFYPSK